MGRWSLDMVWGCNFHHHLPIEHVNLNTSLVRFLQIKTLSKTQNEVTTQLKSSWKHIGADFNFILMGLKFSP